ncbi:MAG: glycosyltransferase [Solirubrobacterales bacterium]
MTDVTRQPAPMRLVIVYFGPFHVNSAIQAFHFASDLTEAGWTVTLAGVGDPETIREVGEPNFECVTHHELPAVAERLRRAGEPAIALAWTPREIVRTATEELVGRIGIPYVIHLEDNEWHLYREAVGYSVEHVRRRSMTEQDRLTPEGLIHPTRSEQFMAGASGITVITEELNEFNKARLPHHVARPGIDSERFRPDLVPPLGRASLGIGEDEFVLVYHGTVHYANQHEMLSLYLAVKLLQRRGRTVRLLRLGETELGGVDPRAFGALREGVVEVGSVGWREIPGYLALADAFVQPGAADDFNRYRLPSKLPEFLAMGRPVALPDCNIGHDLEHERNALLLERGDGLEIADRVERLLDDPELRGWLAEGARRFALEQLNWEHNSIALGHFLNRVAGVAGAEPARSTAAATPVG